jgi:hypothetical protein
LLVPELEDRLAPAILEVSSVADTGGPDAIGTLRKAIADANATTEADTITFSPTVFATQQTITLTGGELTITQPLTIDGPAARVVISGNLYSTRVFRVTTGASTVNLLDLIVIHGKPSQLDSGGGLAIYNAKVSLGNCEFRNNKANDEGKFGTTDYRGGNIYINGGSLTVSGCVIGSNGEQGVATAGQGIGVGDDGAKVTISDATFNLGDTESPGGAIFFPVLATPGELNVANCAIIGNDKQPGEPGAGIYAGNATTMISNSTISGILDGGSGAALYGDGGAITLTNCVIDGNKSVNGDGGGIHVRNGSLAMTGCTVSNNSALNQFGGRGGAIFVSKSSLVMKNCTVAGNSARQGGGVFALGTGSAVNLQFFNCTIASNSALGFDPNIDALGGGICLQGFDSGDSVQIDSTIVAANSIDEVGKFAGPDISTDGFEIFEINSLVQNTGGFATDGDSKFNQNGKSPGFSTGKLADNGGATTTIALDANSLAIDNGRNNANLPTDQRGTGFERVVRGKSSSQEAKADIGAYEYQGAAVQSVKTFGGNGTGNKFNYVQNHSRVTHIEVTFTDPVTLPASLADAFVLTRVSPDSSSVTISSAEVTGGTHVKFTFSNNTEGGGSLVNGVYKLQIVASKVTLFGVPLASDGTGVPGDDFNSPTPAYTDPNPTPANIIFRLYGDGDGDRDVDALNYFQFQQAFGTAGAVFDWDGDGDVDFADYVKFQAAYGSSI